MGHDDSLGDLMVALAASMNEYVPTDRPALTAGTLAAPSLSGGAGAGRPGDDFNRRATFDEVLLPAGWAMVGQRGEIRYWRRPGKDGGGLSATTGHCTSAASGDLLYVFSTNAIPFESESCYSKFAAYALLFHAGDFRSAARELAAQGYGEADEPAGVAYLSPPVLAATEIATTAEVAGTTALAAPERIFLWSSELQLLKTNDKWLWHGYLSRGGITLLSALWKVGKTTMLAHLLKAFEQGGTFAGQAVKPAKVLYVSEESDHLWAERRDEIGLADHVGWVCRPFRGRANAAQWAEFMASLCVHVQQYAFDLVVFDTLAKLWPVRDENDAGGVDNALMPLWTLAEKAAILLVHHLRKSDGGEATGSRGSGALPAFVETIVEMRRFDQERRSCRKRVLSGYGRYRETPEELVIELTEAGYVAHGDRDTASGKDFAETLRGFLPTEPPGLTVDEIATEWCEANGEGVRRQRLLQALQAFASNGGQREGRGTKNDPFTFWRSD